MLRSFTVHVLCTMDLESEICSFHRCSQQIAPSRSKSNNRLCRGVCRDTTTDPARYRKMSSFKLLCVFTHSTNAVRTTGILGVTLLRSRVVQPNATDDHSSQFGQKKHVRGPAESTEERKAEQPAHSSCLYVLDPPDSKKNPNNEWHRRGVPCKQNQYDKKAFARVRAMPRRLLRSFRYR